MPLHMRGECGVVSRRQFEYLEGGTTAARHKKGLGMLLLRDKGTSE
jgi:hypothetical protein